MAGSYPVRGAGTSGRDSLSAMSSRRTTIDAPAAPAAVGPYSHAVRSGELLFCSGQIPLDPETGELVGVTPAEQATRCLQNLQAVCEAAGTTLQCALRLTIYTTRLEDFAAINEAYGEFFDAEPPARAAVGVAALPKGAQVEIDAVVAV
jgi:2-iminobutanoate/2-iminopropanoate deaminase